MPDSLGPALAALSYIAVAAIGLRATYWAFAIRRRLMGRIYRDHALWLGVVALMIAIPESIPLPSNNPFLNSLSVFYTYFPWEAIIAFAFIDSTIPLMRRSDPLLRGILHWKKLRLGLWILFAITTVLGLYVTGQSPTCWLVDDALACASYGGSNSSWLQAAIWTLGYFPGGYFMLAAVLPLMVGAVALLIGARRSRDMVLRDSVKWLGVGLLALCLGLVLVGGVDSMLNLSNYYTTYSYGAVPWEAAFFILGYALYRSARSLAPLNRLPTIESEMTPLARGETSQLSN